MGGGYFGPASLRTSYLSLQRRARFMDEGTARRYREQLNSLDDPVEWARSTRTCSDPVCRTPDAPNYCTILCRCEECRQQGKFVQAVIPIPHSKPTSQEGSRKRSNDPMGMDKAAKARYARAERILLERGVRTRADLDNFDADNGIEGLKGIGPTFSRIIRKARGMSAKEFAVIFPKIRQGPDAAAAEDLEKLEEPAPSAKEGTE